MAQRGTQHDINDDEIYLPGEERYRMERDTGHMPYESGKPVTTQPGTIARFQAMLTEVNQLWAENKAAFENLSKDLPKTGLNTNPQALCLLFYMANRAEKARNRRR